MENRNEVTITFDAYSVNEGFARMVAAAFAAEFNPTLDEIEDTRQRCRRRSRTRHSRI